MISQDQDTACLAVAAEADRVPAWRDFAAYCRLREQGLRKKAFVHLEAFLAEAKRWEFAKQQEFVLWLCSKMESIDDICSSDGLYPNPLKTALFAPFFDEWHNREPNSDEACSLHARYFADPSYYYRAIEINPHNQRARVALAEKCLDDLQYALHHLPEFFIGSEVDATEVAEEAKKHIGQVENSDRRDAMTRELTQLEQLLNDWIAFREEGSDDFEAWCLKKGHHYSWVAAYYYT